MRHPSEVLKGAQLPVEEGFLLACRKSHDKGTTRVREVHHEDLDFLLHPCQDHLRLPPVHLCILPRFKLQRKKGGWPLVRLAPAYGVHVHTRLPSSIPFALHYLKEFVPIVPLLLT